MEVLLYTAFYKPGYKGGGPIKTVSNLIEATGDEVSYHVVTSDRDLGDKRPYPGLDLDKWCSQGKASVFYRSKTVVGRLRSLLFCLNSRYCIVYLNSFFDPFFSVIPLVLSRVCGRRVIVGPRGEFSLGAFSIKSTKKRLFVALFKFFWLHRGVVFQASTEHEAADIKRVLGEHVHVFIAEDISVLERPDAIGVKKLNVLKLVFISRISKKKNLLFGLKILQNVKVDVIFDIFGPIEDDAYWRGCQEVISGLPENVTVRHCGELRPDEVLNQFSRYDLFFFPTRGENYGHVIAEAFCAGLPVLISDETPWRNLESEGIGWDLSLSDPQQFIAALESVARMGSDDYREFRERVLDWAERRFSGSAAVNANLEMFRVAMKS